MVTRGLSQNLTVHVISPRRMPSRRRLVKTMGGKVAREEGHGVSCPYLQKNMRSEDGRAFRRIIRDAEIAKARPPHSFH